MLKKMILLTNMAVNKAVYWRNRVTQIQPRILEYNLPDLANE